MIDPVDQFLDSDFTGPPPTELHQSVLAGTTQLLRRRRRWRRLARAGTMAACFLAGMMTMDLWRHSEPEKQQAQSVQPKAPPNQPVQPAAPPVEAEPPPSLIDLEWRAFDSRENRAALFFQVGDRYFEEHHDFDAALRCYRQALDAAPPRDLAIRTDDNWLVMALKDARLKERNDATVNH